MDGSGDRVSTILIVDDEPDIREVLRLLLSEGGYRLDFAENGLEAYEKAREVVPDLILLDVVMPGMNGFEVCRKLRAEPLLSQIPIIMITALGDAQSRIKGIESGADDFISKPFDLTELSARVKNITSLNRFRELLTERESLKRAHSELERAYDDTLEGWARALELRDAETQGHSRRVTELTLRLARAVGFPEGEMEHIRRGALLHDIGKMGISDAILFKPGPLSQEEWAVMKKHPDYAYKLLYPIPYLRPSLDIPYCHHEKWDGTGYPRGLKGEGIPLSARIFAVVDVWDALSSSRPYRPPMDREWIRSYLRHESEKQFDVRLVEAFLKDSG